MRAGQRDTFISRWTSRTVVQGRTGYSTLLSHLTLALLTSLPAAAPGAEGQGLPPAVPDAYASTYRPLPRTDTLIRGGTLLDGLGGRLENASILLRDGRIAAIGPEVQAPPGAVVVDARGRWITPGLIDAHTHLGNFPAPYTTLDLEHSDVAETTDPNTAEVWAEHSITVQDPQFSRALAGGVTALHVLPGSTPLFGGRGVVLKNVPAVTVREMKFPDAPQSLKMACGENPKYGFGDRGRFPSSRMGNVAGYRAAWVRAREYLAAWEHRARKGDHGPPPARDLELDTLASVLKGEIAVHVHCYRADDMAVVLDVAREFGFHITAFHHATEAYKIAPLLAREGVCAAVWSDWWGFKLEAYDGIRENAAFLDAAGACVALHSDVPSVGQHLTIEAAKAMAAGRRAGFDVPPERALRWLTINPAKMLGLDDRIGSLEVGKNADVVVWSGNPFSIYTKADQVFIDGALVYDRSDPARQPRADFELGQPSRKELP